MGPKPNDLPSPDPHEVERDETGQPETAPEGTAASGFPEPPGSNPGDHANDADPHRALNEDSP